MDFHWGEYELTVKFGRYVNGRIAVMFMSDLFTRYDTFSTNLVHIPLEPDEFIVPAWNHSEELHSVVLATGKFQDTGKRVVGTSWPGSLEGNEAPIWRVTAPTMKDFAEQEAAEAALNTLRGGLT